LINANEARVGTNSELANLSAILSPQSHKLRELLSAGRRASNDGDSQRAISLYEAAYFRAAAVSDRTTAADALFRAARHARRIAEPAVSLEFVGLILNLTDKRTPEVALKGHLALGHHLINAGRDAEVMAVLREAESLFAANLESATGGYQGNVAILFAATTTRATFMPTAKPPLPKATPSHSASFPVAAVHSRTSC
jgi:hypothetical protein